MFIKKKYEQNHVVIYKMQIYKLSIKRLNYLLVLRTGAEAAGEARQCLLYSGASINCGMRGYMNERVCTKKNHKIKQIFNQCPVNTSGHTDTAVRIFWKLWRVGKPKAGEGIHGLYFKYVQPEFKRSAGKDRRGPSGYFSQSVHPSNAA